MKTQNNKKKTRLCEAKILLHNSGLRSTHVWDLETERCSRYKVASTWIIGPVVCWSPPLEKVILKTSNIKTQKNNRGMELLLFLSVAFTLSTAAPDQHRHIRWDPYHCCARVAAERSNSIEVIWSTVTYKLSSGRNFFIWTHYVCSLGHFLWHVMLNLLQGGSSFWECM